MRNIANSGIGPAFMAGKDTGGWERSHPIHDLQKPRFQHGMCYIPLQVFHCPGSTVANSVARSSDPGKKGLLEDLWNLRDAK